MAKIYEEKPTIVKSLSAIKCDSCKKVFDKDDVLEIQEFLSVDFIGGYGSVFGDGAEVKFDLCQHCLKTNFSHLISQS